MKKLSYLLLLSAMSSCLSSDKYILKHAQDTIRCNSKDTTFLTCGKCEDGVYQGRFIPSTVAGLIQERDPEKPTFFMFFDSGCHGYPRTMPPYLKTVLANDIIAPVLILVDAYDQLPIARARIATWGWRGPVFVLDESHYGCYRFFSGNKNELVLKEFNIEETEGYYQTVHLEVMVNPEGHVTGYSNYHDLPGELRGQNLPKY